MEIPLPLDQISALAAEARIAIKVPHHDFEAYPWFFWTGHVPRNSPRKGSQLALRLYIRLAVCKEFKWRLTCALLSAFTSFQSFSKSVPNHALLQLAFCPSCFQARHCLCCSCRPRSSRQACHFRSDMPANQSKHLGCKRRHLCRLVPSCASIVSR